MATQYARTFQWLQDVFEDEPYFVYMQESRPPFELRTDLDALVLFHPIIRELLKTGEPPPHKDPRGRPTKLTEAMITSTASPYDRLYGLINVPYFSYEPLFGPKWVISEPYFSSSGAGPSYQQLSHYEISLMIWERIHTALDEWNESAPDVQLIRKVGYHVDIHQREEPHLSAAQQWRDRFLGIRDAIRQHSA